MVAILPLKQHRAVGLDLDERAVAELNVPCTVLSSLQKTSLQLVMWLVVPVSRYQPSWISPAPALPRYACARGSMWWTVVDDGTRALFSATCAISSVSSSSSSYTRCA